MFVDVQGALDGDDLVRPLRSQPLLTCGTVVFRWPTVERKEPPSHSALLSFFSHRALRKLLKESGVRHVGILVHRFEERPIVVWEGEGPESYSDEDVVNRLLRAEIRALLEAGHAIWLPRNYHYELPSGDHTDSFIRVADAFQDTRDVEVVALWFTHLLKDNMGVVLDNSSLVPLVVEFRRLLAQRGWNLAGVETLDNYPTTTLDIALAIEGIGDHGSILAIMSVNASGRYRSLIHSAITNRIDPSLVVLIDKQPGSIPNGVQGKEVDNVQLASWIAVGVTPDSSHAHKSDCKLCLGNDKAQIVRIDGRSFNAFALPQDNLLTPDTKSARGAREFFELCDRFGGLSINAVSYSPIRSRERMAVRIDFGSLLVQAEFRNKVVDRISSEVDQSIDHIVVADVDFETPGFRELLLEVKSSQSLPADDSCVSIVSVATGEDTLLAANKMFARPLMLTLGSVSGWLLRRLQIFTQDFWHEKGIVGEGQAIVVYSRVVNDRKWDNLFQSFEKRLSAIWTSYLPEFSPHEDEYEFISGLLVDPYIETLESSVSEKLKNFIADRKSLCGGSAILNSSNVLWAPTPDSRLRNTSIFGHKIDAATTYAAVGAAIQSKRQMARVSDPRWPVFDFVSIGRSYFDGLLVACMLRWCAASEIWWGEAEARTSNIKWLIANTRELDDQRILFSELVYAACRGKVPLAAIEEMCGLICAEAQDWALEDRLPVAAGLACLGALGATGEETLLKNLIADLMVSP